MGACSSSEGVPDRRKDLEIEKVQHVDQASTQRKIKLLFLGAGESGKSTFFKQMVKLYGNGFSEDDKLDFIPLIHKNVIECIQELIAQVNGDLGKDLKVSFSDDLKDSVQTLVELHKGLRLLPEHGALVARLWKNPAVQAVFLMRNRFQIPDCCEYFLSKVDELVKADYVPNEQDIFRCRTRTTGILQIQFEVESNEFEVYDVGGQRSERKKWMSLFDIVNAIIFVSAISEYDMTLFEDNSKNRMEESLELFQEVCHYDWFEKTPVILFLNKRDLFAEKFVKKPLGQYYPDFTGSTVEDGYAFMNKLFLDRNPYPQKQIISHVTCATDTDNVDRVFISVREILITGGLAEAGLLQL